MPFAIVKGGDSFGGERAGKQATAQAADAESSRLFGSKNNEFDAAPGFESGFFESTDGLQRAENADNAIVTACIRNGVNMGAGCDRRQFQIRTAPTGEDIA